MGKCGSLVLHRTPLALCVAVGLATVTGFAVASDDRSAPSHTPADRNGPARPAAMLTVTSCADDGSPGTLRAVIAGAASGDTVDLTGLTCSTITLQSGQIVIHVDNLTIAGPGAVTLTVDANQSSNTGYSHYGRAFYHDGVGTLTINSLTVANGLINQSDLLVPSTNGGCIYSKNGAVTLNDSVVTNCRALTTYENTRGGGVSARYLVTLNRSTISENQAIASGQHAHISSGGGIFVSAGDIFVGDSLITGNRAESSYSASNTNYAQASGGGISSYLGAITVSGSIISNNFAGCDTDILHCSGAFGGGIKAAYQLTLMTSSVSDNVVQADHVIVGGGIDADTPNRNILIDGSEISGNLAQAPQGGFPYGGGLRAWGYIISASNSTISNNFAGYGAGGVLWIAGSPSASTITNSTISGNVVANGLGGGIFVHPASGPLSISNSTVTLNVSNGPYGGGGILALNSSINTFESSIVAGNINTANAPPYDADLGVSLGEIEGANNLIVAANGVTLPPDTISADPMLGPLQENGGPTLTHALLSGSPALDAGNNFADLDFDQRGVGFPRVSGLSADIGAFEFEQPFSAPTVGKSFMPATIVAGGVSLLTITLVNGDNIAATLSADLTDILPPPVIVVDSVGAATTCPNGVVSAAAGSGAVVLDAGAQIPAGGSCTVTVSVTSDVQGDYTNTIAAGALQTDVGNNPDPATAELMVDAVPPIPPTVTKAFVSDTIQAGTPSTLTITLGNENAIGATLIAPLADTLPSPVIIASPANATTTCPGGVLAADSGSGVVTLDASAGIPPAATCTVTVSVTANAEGTYTNTIAAGALQTDLGNNPDPATADLTVTATPPTVAKAFAPDTISVGTASALTITLSNKNEVAAVLSSALADVLPPPVVIADPPNASTTCPGGTVTADAGAATVTLGVATEIPPVASCVIEVSVTADSEGVYTNVIPVGALQTDLGGNAALASAVLTVTPATIPDRIFADGFDGTTP